MANELHFNILPPKQLKLLRILQELEWISAFHLAGGTALALQIDHRRSVDFDFFTDKDIGPQEVKGTYLKEFNK